MGFQNDNFSSGEMGYIVGQKSRGINHHAHLSEFTKKNHDCKNQIGSFLFGCLSLCLCNTGTFIPTVASSPMIDSRRIDTLSYILTT
jgi:hypothetical protein